MELAGAAWRVERPDVLQPEVRRELVDAPRPGGVRGGFELHGEKVLYIHACTYVTGRAAPPYPDRAARVWRAGALAPRLRQPRPRAGGARRGLHARRAVPPVQGQGGPGARRLEWTDETWRREVGEPAAQESDPVAALLAMARGHAVLCRRDVARVAMALRLEFSGQDHPVGRELDRVSEGLVRRCARLIEAGRKEGSIPPGPPARTTARAFIGALEGAVIALGGQAPHDEVLAARAVRVSSASAVRRRAPDPPRPRRTPARRRRARAGRG